MSNGRQQTREVNVPSTELEPVAEKRPVPVLLIALLVVLFFWGDLYVMRNGGDVGGERGAFPAMVYSPYKSYADIPKPKGAGAGGAKVFDQICSACHQATGMGNPAQGVPPLAGSEWVLTENPERAIRIVLNGLTGPITVKGQPFNATMLGWKDMLTDEQVAAVLTYVRNTWGNQAPSVTPEQVKAVRAATAGRATYWTEPELSQVPEK